MKLLINLMFLRAVPLGFIQESELCLADCSSSLTQTHYHKTASSNTKDDTLDLPPLCPLLAVLETMTVPRESVKPWCPNTTPSRGRHPGILHDMACAAASTAPVDPPTAPSPIEPAQPLAAAPSTKACASLLQVRLKLRGVLELVESTSQSA